MNPIDLLIHNPAAAQTARKRPRQKDSEIVRKLPPPSRGPSKAEVLAHIRLLTPQIPFILQLPRSA
jgi:hypothetical protein